MFEVLVCHLAILLPLGSSGPIVTPEGIAQSHGIEALFGREAEFGIKPTPKGRGHESPTPLPTGQLGLLQPLPKAVVFDSGSKKLKKYHGFKGESVSPEKSVRIPELHSLVPYDLHGSQGSPTFPTNRDSHHYDKPVSPGPKILHGSVASYSPYGSHTSKGIQGLPSLKSIASSKLSGSYIPHVHPNPIQRVVLIRKGRQVNPVPSRSDDLLRGIISDIRKDFLNPAGIRSFNPQPSRRVITFSDPNTPGRSDGLLTGIISGIKKDIFIGGDPHSLQSPSPSPSTTSSLLPSTSSPSSPQHSASSTSSSPSPTSSFIPSSSPLPSSSLSTLTTSPPSLLHSSTSTFSSTSSSPSPPSSSSTLHSLSRVISPVQSTTRISSSSSLSPLLSSTPISSSATLSLSTTSPPSNSPLVSPLPSLPTTSLSSSSSGNEDRPIPERSTDLLQGILSGIRRDIFTPTSSRFKNGGRTS